MYTKVLNMSLRGIVDNIPEYYQPEIFMFFPGKSICSLLHTDSFLSTFQRMMNLFSLST